VCVERLINDFKSDERTRVCDHSLQDVERKTKKVNAKASKSFYATQKHLGR